MICSHLHVDISCKVKHCPGLHTQTGFKSKEELERNGWISLGRGNRFLRVNWRQVGLGTGEKVVDLSVLWNLREQGPV